jgi:hypothetical protein
MSYCGVEISSVNFSGQTTNVVFMPDSGGTITLGEQVFPFNYNSEYYYGTFYCYIPSIKYTYTVVVPGPTPTPTATPPITPTPQPTPTPSPVVVYSYNLWTDTVWNDACEEAGYGPSNVTIYTSVEFNNLSYGDYVYGDALLTIPPVGAQSILANQTNFIQIDPYTGEVINTGDCP